jgi:nicotinamide-nucleotide amidase
MTAAVFSIGTELTRGELVNTNAAWLGEQLTALGFTVTEHVTVDDDHARIVAALERVSKSATLIVATGGLGPTTDDLTTAAVAKAAGVGLFRDDASLEKIRRRWATLGREMPRSNEKQADFPEGADIIPNPVGTAPGFAITINAARCFFLPGVPREMTHLFEESVVHAIGSLVHRTTHQVHLRSFGLTESQTGELLRGIEEECPGITLGYRASFPEIEVKVFARATTASEAESHARACAEKVRARLGDAVYGERDDSFPGAIGRLLREKGLTLAVAESCTGGLIGEMVTSVPGSSDYMLMDAVVYSNSSKTKVLGVNADLLRAHGAVSGEVAAAMAEGALRTSGADLAVSVTGIAGPGGGSEEKPVGTVWFALARKDRETIVKTRRLHGDRERIRTLAAYVALRMVGRAAQGVDPASE